MSDFKGRHFGGEIVLWAVRWYCRYPISYRDLETMMTERGVAVDHSTIYRWVQHFAPEMERRLRWQWRWPRSRSWRIDETYVKVRGKWAYLYRALDKLGNTIDFYLSSTRNTKAAKRFLGKALNGLKDWEQPEVLNTDKAPTYAGAIAELKAEGKCPNETRHRQVKYLNNVVEADRSARARRPNARGLSTKPRAAPATATRLCARLSASLRPKPSAVWPKPWLNAAAPARGSGDMQHGLAGKAAFDQVVGSNEIAPREAGPSRGRTRREQRHDGSVANPMKGRGGQAG